jgi:hypothetical protein
MILPPALGYTEPNGSLDTLAALQIRLRDQQETALVQVWVNEARRVLYVYAHGILVGSYALGEGVSLPILQANLSSYWNGQNAAIQRVPVSGKVGRMAWLALESSLQGRFDVGNEAEWKKLLEQWRGARFHGVAQIVSQGNLGYLFWEGGTPIAEESAWMGEPALESMLGREPVSLTAFVPTPESNAWECLSLRRYTTKWINGILTRFAQVAGARFAQIASREILSQIQPWQWQISVENERLRDDHFFPRVAAATHAYRNILMCLESQMEFVIGNTLTQRILSEKYYELDGEERAMLASNRLIPAAFSQ